MSVILSGSTLIAKLNKPDFIVASHKLYGPAMRYYYLASFVLWNDIQADVQCIILAATRCTVYTEPFILHSQNRQNVISSYSIVFIKYNKL